MSEAKKEVKTETATTTAPAAKTGFDPSKVKVTKNLTLPVLKTSIGIPAYVRIIDPIFKGKLLAEEVAKGKDAKDAADIINVNNLETGQDQQIIGGMVLINTLREAYPEDSYVGKTFMLTKGEQKGTGSKKYHPWSIQEIDV